MIHRAREAGVVDRLVVDSAGTWASEGQWPHPMSVAVAEANGVDIGVAQTSRSVAPDDLQTFDHVLAMDRRNLADLHRFIRLSAFGAVEGTTAKLRLLRHVIDPRCEHANIPDPIRGGEDAFAATFALIDSACRALLRELQLGESHAGR